MCQRTYAAPKWCFCIARQQLLEVFREALPIEGMVLETPTSMLAAIMAILTCSCKQPKVTFRRTVRLQSNAKLTFRQTVRLQSNKHTIVYDRSYYQGLLWAPCDQQLEKVGNDIKDEKTPCSNKTITKREKRVAEVERRHRKARYSDPMWLWMHSANLNTYMYTRRKLISHGSTAMKTGWEHFFVWTVFGEVFFKINW